MPNRPFYVVADLTETDKLPPSILFWSYNFFSKAPCTLRQIFVVTNNHFVEGMVTTFRRVFDKYQRAIAVVQSNEEALHLIHACVGCDKNP
ncbi:MAG: hypothetical protein KF716_16020 [Anaerolineae bacterium]|nr:hypothetical protein [Anaerolineae bacterium]